MPVTVRLANSHEAPIVHTLMLAAFAEYDGVLEVPSGALVETVDDVLAHMLLGGAVLALDGEEVVGSGRFERRDGYLYIGRLSVPPAHRRRGIGGLMMDTLEDIGRSEGFPEARIGVRTALPQNLALYQSRGYKITATYPHPKGTELIVDMAKRL